MITNASIKENINPEVYGHKGTSSAAYDGIWYKHSKSKPEGENIGHLCDYNDDLQLGLYMCLGRKRELDELEKLGVKVEKGKNLSAEDREKLEIARRIINKRKKKQ